MTDKNEDAVEISFQGDIPQTYIRRSQTTFNKASLAPVYINPFYET
ncbi:hypothetical protein [Sphingobacterium sp. BIGb0165]|nr:hypothetical protein [Sphingobacterium sp. BIGb0165]MCS4229064.1 hypothetical protein [Sphingobacterium sp. BIGb0165]